MFITSVLLIGGGFLLAVLWFDLMFDVQVRGHAVPELPEPVLASISGYYRRVTTTARPMGYLVAGVMIVTVGAVGIQFSQGSGPLWLRLAPVALCGAPIALGLSRTFPNAVRLGARRGTLSEQSGLARSIYWDHVFCFGGIALFLALQVGLHA